MQMCLQSLEFLRSQWLLACDCHRIIEEHVGKSGGHEKANGEYVGVDRARAGSLSGKATRMGVVSPIVMRVRWFMPINRPG